MSLLFFVQFSFGTTYYSRSSNNWSNRNTWSLTSGGGRVGNGVYPVAGDIVNIEGGNTVTIDQNSACITLNIASSSTLTFSGGYNLTVSGVSTINGTIELNQYNGTKIFTGLVTINSGGTWNNSVDSPVTFRGGITNNGTFTAGNTYVYTFDTNSQALNGDINMTGSTVTVTGINLTNNGTLTLGSALNGTGALINSSSGTLNIEGSGYINIATLNNQGNFTLTSSGGFGTATPNFTNTGTINLNGSGYIAGITNNANGTINFINAAQTIGTVNNATSTSVLNISALISSASAINTLTATTSGNIVNYSGLGNQTIKNVTYSNLTISGSGTKTLSGATSVTGILTLTNGILSSTTTNLLSITNTATTAISGGSSTSYIDGPLIRTLPASLTSGSTYLFPVGKSGNYKPFTLVNPTTGTGTTTIQVEAFATNSGGTFDATLESISTVDYWQLTKSGNFTNTSISLGRSTAISPLNVIAASTTQGGIYTSYKGTAGTNEVTNSNTVTIGSNPSWYFVLGSFTPKITVSTSSLSGFTYALNNGPSAQQTFTASGINLSTNITITPSTNYEISTTSGSGFQSTPIVLTQTGGAVSTTTIYVRLKSGLAVGSYNSENIALTSTGATTKNVTCNGSVYTPTITTSVSSLTGFTYNVGNGPSAQQTFTTGGTNLTTNITVTPSSNYEISTTSGSGFQQTPVTLTQVGGTVATTTIYVRLKAGLSAGTYNSDNISLTSTGATSKNITCTGIVNTPAITVSNTSLTDFSYDFSSGPSVEQPFTVSGIGLSTNISVAPSTNFEISTTSGSGFQSTALTLTQTGGVVPATTIYVRLKAGLAIGVYSSENIISSSTGVTSKTVVVSGSVYSTFCSSYGNTTYQTSITLVNFNAINNSSAKPSGYSNYTTSTTNVNAGSSYNLTVNVNTDGNYKVYANAWIDWNHNGDFTDSGESYSLGNVTNTTNGGTSLSPLSITIPSNASSGKTRMRISAKYNTAPTSCETSFDGEVEDYSLNVILPSIYTGTISGSPFNAGNSVSVPFTISGSYVSGNIFTAQLSNASGSFTAPVNIGTLTSTSAGTISAIIPTNTVTGTGYRIRVISSNPTVTGSDNGTNISINGNSTISVSTTSLTGFTYAENNGPSTEKSFTVSGVGLSQNINLTLPVNSNYELSTTSGGVFLGSVNALLNNDGSGAVPSTTIYVRLKAGLTVNTYNDVITATSTGATDKTVSLTGNVTNQPLITTTPSALTGLSYVLGNGPSTFQSFNVTGSNLQYNITVTAPTNFQIATSSGGTYGSSLTLTQSGGNVNTTIWVRLKAGLSTSIYDENITLNSNYAATKTVNCQGAVNRATINVSQFTLAGFIYTLNSGPSEVQSFNVSGNTLSANVVLTAPTNFEIATSSGGTYGSSISLTPTSGTSPNLTLSSTPIFVRMKSGITPVKVIPAENITLTSTNAITQSVACSGAVVSAAATISSNPTLNGFFYIVGQGPSVTQMFTVSATSLGANNVTVTAPTDFEIYTPTYNSGAWGSTIILTPSGGKINAAQVYIRLKSGRIVGIYNETLTLTSATTTTVSVACNGKVVAQPTIIAGPSNPLSACDGSSVTLTSTGTNILNQTWSGPNNFYSSDPNPSLGTVSPTKSGDYTVTGNIGSGVNLLTNGDFELGNTGFGSTYDYNNSLGNTYGAYWIISNPSTASPTYFLDASDHTPGAGTLQMVIDGAETTGAIVWAQTIAVTPNTAYQFSYWAENINKVGNNNYAKLQLYINNVPSGTINTISALSWVQFLSNINSGSSTSLQITLINSYIGGSGNDFALDDLNFEQVFQVNNTLSLTVNPMVTPSVTIAPSSNPATAGATVTFTATPTNGGATPTYAWYVGNTLQIGASGSTFSYVPTNGDIVKCVLTSSLTCTTINPVNNTVTMVVNPATNYWRGTNSTDWGTASNWTAGYIPIPGADVVYATVANYGSNAVNNLVLDQDRTQGSLINQTTKSLVIPVGKRLTINNSITTDGNVDRIYIQASSTTANGSLIFYANSPVYGTVEMWSQSSWDTGRPANQRYNWQFFGIPIDTVKASPTVDGAYIRFRDEAGNDTTTHWHSLTNTSNIIPFYGYELCYQTQRLLAFKGKLVNRNFNSGQLTKTTTGGVLYGGQHIFANPYTAAIDIRQIDFGSDMEQTIYFYNTGTFAQWNAGTAGKIGSTPGQYTAATKQLAGTSQIPRQIPSMSSMLVRVINSTSNSYLRINYNTVTMSNSELQRAPSVNGVSTDFVCTRIDVESKYSIDKMWLFADDQLSHTYDNGYDAKKMAGSALNQQIYAVEEDGNYQINAVNDFNNTSIAFQAGQDTVYKMTFTNENIDKKYSKLYLYDIQENKVVDVTENGSTYEFTALSTPKPVLRFKIITKSDSTTTDGTSNIVYFNINNTLYLYNQGQEICKVYVYDISGRNVGQRSIAASGNANISLTPQHTYILKMASSTSNESKKIMIQ